MTKHPLGTWVYNKEFNYSQIWFNEGSIALEPRPHYCDRGNWIAKLLPDGGTELARSIDGADMWPRYYFDLERAKLEIRDWIMKRGLL